eukprot:SM000016S01891  [mRNA]  locus=s16:456233:458139:+ [translate_table: standard]
MSSSLYTSGVFQTVLQCAAGDTTGLDTTFYLDSNGGPTADHDGINFDFLGNSKTSVLTSWYSNGVGSLLSVQLPFDCSTAPHLYTIYWDTTRIAWYIDEVLVRNVPNPGTGMFPSKPMYLFGSIWDASTSTLPAGIYTGIGNPFAATYTFLAVQTPVGPGTVPSPPPPPLPPVPDIPSEPLQGIPLVPLTTDYCADHASIVDNNVVITFDHSCGSRFRSTVQYPSGAFRANIKCPDGDFSGLVPSFYLSSLEGSGNQDEIDFEWLGKDKTVVQTNYYVNGVGGREVLIHLGFDCSAAFHEYTILWDTYRIVWYIDGVIVRVAPNIVGQPFPVKPSFLYASVWDASSICGGCWAGINTWSLPAYYMQYQNITIQSPVAL